MKALIYCAGLGTRLKPITDGIPKPMIHLGGKPILEHIVDHLERQNIVDIVVNLHHKPSKIYKYFGTRLLYFYEPELLGEIKTLRIIREFLKGEDLLVLNGDTIYFADLRRFKHITTYVTGEMVNTSRCGGIWYIPGKSKIDLKVKHMRELGKWLHIDNAPRFHISTPERLEMARRYFEKANTLPGLL